MIKYSLVCAGSHEFEGWFQNGDAYEKEVASGRLACPHCGSREIDKAIMAPAVARSASRFSSGPEKVPAHEMQRLMKKLREEVVAKAEYVGSRFAEEARRMHFDESPAQSIYGEATADEARELAEEGIPFLPLPPSPEDLN